MIFEMRITTEIKKRKNLLVINALFIGSSPSLSLSFYLTTISIKDISYRISSSGFIYVLLRFTLPTTSDDSTRERKRGAIYLCCSPLLFLYIQNHSFIIFFLFFRSRSAFRMLSIKYYPRATRDTQNKKT